MRKKEQLDELLNRPKPRSSQDEINNGASTSAQEPELESFRVHSQSNPRINFRDLEDSLDKFDDGKDIQIWIEQLEQNAAIFNWSPLEMLVYGRKLIQGLPKRYISLELKPNSWIELKRGLLTEYKREHNSALIHKKMASEKKSSTESFNEYFYRMIEMAGDQIDVKALITYIVDGIKDNIPNKLFLYNSKTLTELKDRVKEYQEIKSTKSEPANNTRQHCYNCGDLHKTNECPNNSRGVKCFKCNQFGHISRSCEASEQKPLQILPRMNTPSIVQSRRKRRRMKRSKTLKIHEHQDPRPARSTTIKIQDQQARKHIPFKSEYREKRRLVEGDQVQIQGSVIYLISYIQIIVATIDTKFHI